MIKQIVFYFVLVLVTHSSAQAQPSSPTYPGVISLEVDGTDLDHRIFKVKQTIPVKPGAMGLWLPQWLPGNHAPTGPLVNIAGLKITGNGKTIEWKRGTIDVYAFNFEVPSDVNEIEVNFQNITSPVGPGVMAPAMLNLKWNATALYPVGYDANQVSVQASLKLPKGWKPFCALDIDKISGDLYRYKTTDFETLVDSPVFAGQYFKVVDLDPGAKAPVRLNIVADDPRFLEIKPEQLEVHRNLVKQAYKLFDSQHYDRYDFLFSLSKQMIGNGLEHHRSSENGLYTDYFIKANEQLGFPSLLAHEFTHSWNGKFRRPQDLKTPHYNVPMQNSLLWMYEGQTQYWGEVLTSRAGMRNPQASLDAWALVAATYGENRPGLSWRALQDTTNDPIISRRSPKPYTDWQLAEDYYRGAQMMWLEADVKIRSLSGGKKSLDDFASAFFSMDNGLWKVKTYVFDDIVNTLNDVVAFDWETFLRTRLEGHGTLTGGIEASGWRLVFKDTPNAAEKARSALPDSEGANYTYSLGMVIAKDGAISNVRWDSPAFRAGIGTGMTLVAVNDRQYDKDLLDRTIAAAAKNSNNSIKLMVKSFDVFRTITVDYKGGLRYPHLERIAGATDYLTPILSPR